MDIKPIPPSPQIKEKEGGLKERAAEAREDVIKKINHDTGGTDQYDHLYRDTNRLMGC